MFRMSKSLMNLCTSFYGSPSQCIHATQILNEKCMGRGGEQQESCVREAYISSWGSVSAKRTESEAEAGASFKVRAAVKDVVKWVILGLLLLLLLSCESERQQWDRGNGVKEVEGKGEEEEEEEEVSLGWAMAMAMAIAMVKLMCV